MTGRVTGVGWREFDDEDDDVQPTPCPPAPVVEDPTLTRHYFVASDPYGWVGAACGAIDPMGYDLAATEHPWEITCEACAEEWDFEFGTVFHLPVHPVTRCQHALPAGAKMRLRCEGGRASNSGALARMEGRVRAVTWGR
jgi:hypothetical protein